MEAKQRDTQNSTNGAHPRTSRSAVACLPKGVIERILQFADPETFASLSVLDKTWHDASKNEDLYARQLLQCPAVSSGGRESYDTLRRKGLNHMRQLLAREGRQDLWNSFAYRESTFRLVAPSTSTSTALPRGDVLKFKFSSTRRLILAVSSSRIFIIDPQGHVPMVLRELKIRRRPFAADVSGDGSVLALLTAGRRLNVYRLTESQPHRGQAIQLQNSAKSIALSPDSSVVAAAGDAGIEIISLSQSRIQGKTRLVRSQPMDFLTFSADGMVLIGTQTKLEDPLTIAIHTSPRPVFDPEEAFDESLEHLWISQPFFPNTFRQCGYAVPLPNKDFEDTDKAFAFDAPADAFGTLDLRALRFISSTESRGPLLRPSKSKGWTSPAVDDTGDLVAIADSRLRLHIVATADPRRVRQVALDEALFSICWIADSQNHVQRLMGVLPPEKRQAPPSQQEDAFPLDVGRLAAFDFGHPLDDGEPTEQTIQLETGRPESLDDSTWGLEIDLQIQSDPVIDPRVGNPNGVKSAPPPLGRSVTQARRGSRTGSGQRRNLSNASGSNASESNESSGHPGLSLEAAQYSFDDFSPGEPRNRTTLQRAATAAAVNRRPRHEPESNEPVIRHQSGRWEVPDESDADNWVPPPPPYPAPATNATFQPPQSFVTPPPSDPHQMHRSLTDSMLDTARPALPQPVVAIPPVPAIPVSHTWPLPANSRTTETQPSDETSAPSVLPSQAIPVAAATEAQRNIAPSEVFNTGGSSTQSAQLVTETGYIAPAPIVPALGEPLGSDAPRDSISNASAVTPPMDASGNLETDQRPENSEASRSLPPSVATTGRSSMEPQNGNSRSSNFVDPVSEAHSGPAPREQEIQDYGSSGRPHTPPLQIDFDNVGEGDELSLQSPHTPTQMGTPPASSPTGSPNSPASQSVLSERRRNTLIRRDRDRDSSSRVKAQKRRSLIFPSNPLPQTQRSSELAEDAPRSASAFQPVRTVAPDFNGPSADQLASLNRRYTLIAQDESLQNYGSVPSSAAGARRSLPPVPYPPAVDDSSHTGAARPSGPIPNSVSDVPAPGQEEYPSQYPADRRFYATMASVASNRHAFRSETALGPPIQTHHIDSQRRNFTTPLASTSSVAVDRHGESNVKGDGQNPSRSSWARLQNRLSVSDTRSYRSWKDYPYYTTPGAAMPNGSRGDPRLPGQQRYSEAYGYPRISAVPSMPGAHISDSAEESPSATGPPLQYGHATSAALPPAAPGTAPPVGPQLGRGKSGGGLSRFKSVLGGGVSSGREKQKQKEKSGSRCLVM